MNKEYALYKGEDILAFGTIDEIAQKLGVKKETVAYYKKNPIIYRDSTGTYDGIDGAYLDNPFYST